MSLPGVSSSELITLKFINKPCAIETEFSRFIRFDLGMLSDYMNHFLHLNLEGNNLNERKKALYIRFLLN